MACTNTSARASPTRAIGAAQVLDYQRTAAAHALAKARAEIAARGLMVTVVQAFYGLLAAQTRTVNAERANDEGQHFLELSQKLEQGGEVAHSDTIKAQIQANDLKRARDEAKLAEQNARLSLAVLLFPNFFQDFTLVNDLSTAPALPPMNELQQMAAKKQSELQAAFAALAVANKQVGVARAGYLPSLSVDMFYGIDANQFAKRAPDGTQNLWLCRHRDAEHSCLELGRDAEQGAPGGIAAPSGAGGIERRAAAGRRRSAVVLRRGATGLSAVADCCSRPPILPNRACASPTCATRRERPARWKWWTRKTR